MKNLSGWLDKTCKNLAEKRLSRVPVESLENEHDDDRHAKLKNLMQRKRTLSMSLPPDRSTRNVGHWFAAKDVSMKEWVDRKDEEFAEKVRISESNRAVKQKFEMYFYADGIKESSPSGYDMTNLAHSSISMFEAEPPVSYEEPISIEEREDDFACTLARLERARRKLEELTRINPIVEMPQTHYEESETEAEAETLNELSEVCQPEEAVAEEVIEEISECSMHVVEEIQNQTATETKRVSNGGIVKPSPLSIAKANLTLIFARDNSKKSSRKETGNGTVITLFDAARKLADALSKREKAEKEVPQAAEPVQQAEEAVFDQIAPELIVETLTLPETEPKMEEVSEPQRASTVKAKESSETILISRFEFPLDDSERLFVAPPEIAVKSPEPAVEPKTEEPAKAKRGRMPKKAEVKPVETPAATTTGAKKRGRPRKNAAVEAKTMDEPKPSKKKQRGGKKKA